MARTLRPNIWQKVNNVERLKSRIKGQLLENESLAKYTAARLGGTAEWVYVTKDSITEMVTVVETAWELDMPIHVLGSGANVLVSDKGMPGLVIINRLSDIEIGDWHEGRNLSAASGTKLSTLAQKCASVGYSGMEWAVSVPGTVGGAVVTNAGAHERDMSDNLADVVVLEAERGVQLYKNEELEYGYRTSVLKELEDKRFIVLLATFRMEQGDPQQIKALMDEYNSYRKRTQPPGASLGSVFKNPEGDYAGRIIELAGLMRHRIGGMEVSPIHANFFINRDGKGTASEFYELVRYVQEKVAERMEIELEPEIQFLGDFD